MESKSGQNSAIKNLDMMAKLMDSQFRIPGTNIKFGVDPLIGLFPGIGDIAGFLISGYMIVVLVKNGASGYVLARMLLNISIDTLLGSVPIVGDFFDIAFKSNQLNMKLMHEHYAEGRHRGGAWKVIVPVLFVLLVLMGGLAWVGYKILMWLFHFIS